MLERRSYQIEFFGYIILITYFIFKKDPSTETILTGLKLNIENLHLYNTSLYAYYGGSANIIF